MGKLVDCSELSQFKYKINYKFTIRLDDDEDDKPQHQYYYVKQKFVASYEAILPISTSANREDINSEECFEFICVPTVDESSTDYAEGDAKVHRRCPQPKCPQGYMIRLQIQKDANQCAKYVFHSNSTQISEFQLSLCLNAKFNFSSVFCVSYVLICTFFSSLHWLH